MQKRGKDQASLRRIIELLVQGKQLPAKYKNHPLSGSKNNEWDCHIEPDWVLIYIKNKNELKLVRTGTHSDLFQ